MPNLLQTAATFLTSQLTAHASQPVVFRRGTQEIEVLAVPGQITSQQTDEFNRITRKQMRDWIVRLKDLTVEGEVLEPVEGDQVLCAVGGRVHRYGVYSPGGNEPPYRYTDPYHTAMRIHTELDGVEP